MGRTGSPRLPRAAVKRSSGQVLAAVGPIAERIAAEQQVSIWDLSFTQDALTVAIDTPDGIGLDAITFYAEALSHALDEADVIPGGRYRLEVGSPGAERKLRRPQDFVFCIGRKVRVTFKGPRDLLTGELQGVDDDGFVVSEEHVAFSEISQAQLTSE